MIQRDEDNAFTKILTTDPGTTPEGTPRQQSWFESLKKRASISDGDLTTCPSCQGTGIKGYSSELVALIPYNDERLKPRRTKMKILCALLICGFVLGLLTYMFLPGDVVVVPIDARIVNASIAQTNWVLENKHWGTSQIYWKVNITVQNHNRVLTITVDMLNVLLKIDAWDRTLVGNETFGNFTVAANSNKTVSYHLPTGNYQHNQTGNYSDAVLNCRCCRQYTTWGDIFMLTSATLHYSLRLAGFQYFSSFTSSEQHTSRGNCNYFDNIGVLDIACETYNSCVK